MALSPNQLQNISNELEDLWGDFETEVLSQLAQKIKANDDLFLIFKRGDIIVDIYKK